MHLRLFNARIVEIEKEVYEADVERNRINFFVVVSMLVKKALNIITYRRKFTKYD